MSLPFDQNDSVVKNRNKIFQHKHFIKLNLISKNLRTGVSMSLSAVWIVLRLLSRLKEGTVVTKTGKSVFRKPARVRQIHAKISPASQWALRKVCVDPRRRI
jgi:hypothetical protein